ncbi:hypothetical protein BOTBODRAFT_119605 [Botryobasidium botryosum FD-172 SS1]|uniref:Replication factor C subunit 1 n=1 Tax=Botryobasidium botryosum (strain FD-172 SS1) TaxID=930990 RepID=A0A067M7B6_BOTB1|nr:hypothetical protein BOTBODRAFT_119605 [Botryobasidium botryosum FD-172 SS1]
MDVDTPAQPPKRKKRVIIAASTDDEDEGPPKKKQGTAVVTKPGAKPQPRASETKRATKAPAVKRKSKSHKEDDDFVADSPEDDRDDGFMDDEVEKKSPKKSKSQPEPKSRASKTKAKGMPRRKPPVKQDRDDDFIDDDDDEPSKSTKAKPRASASKTKADDHWAAIKAAKLAGPSAPGSKAVPDGQPNCLAGLAFVFTGELSSFSREEAIDLAKRFGGRVTGQPSSKTSYVVVGDNAGPSKLAAIKKIGVATLDEDGFLNLIATREGKLDEKAKEKLAKEEKKIREAARELEKAEKKADKEAKSSGGTRPVDSSEQLWTTKYAPKSLKEICGNKTQVEKLQSWLHDWFSSYKSGFKKPGKHGCNIFRAVLITGPPGIGKTTSAHLCAQAEGYTPIELNASDARSKKLVESSTNINNTSLDGWMSGGKSTTIAGMEITNKTCLIMDEVDGMSAGDRGGVGALNALIKKTKIPIICIANDRTAIKLKPLIATTFNMTFRKPEATNIRSRIMTIAFKENMKIPPNVVDQLVIGAQSDIRQVLNMLSTWKLSNDTMDFDEGKELAKMNEKYSVMTPWNIMGKLLGPYLFSATSRETLNDKMELYFHDHAFVPLFVQENYAKTTPSRANSLNGPEQILRQLQLLDKAASAISDGDLVDAMIHGTQQHWSLMPLHAITSTVRPASFIYGSSAGGYGGGHGGPISFPSWLGQNSKQTKLRRQLGDVQIRMRLKVSGDKAEIRQNYIPALFPRIVQPLIGDGQSAVPDVIEIMDEYYLSKEDWDTIVELGVDDHNDDMVMKKIATATKSAFTRKYNASEHPIPFHKALDIFGKPSKKIAVDGVPDHEDVLEALDAPEEDEEEDRRQAESTTDAIGKDKLIRESKAKGGKGKAKGKAKE